VSPGPQGEVGGVAQQSAAFVDVVRPGAVEVPVDHGLDRTGDSADERADDRCGADLVEFGRVTWSQAEMPNGQNAHPMQCPGLTGAVQVFERSECLLPRSRTSWVRSGAAARQAGRNRPPARSVRWSR